MPNDTVKDILDFLDAEKTNKLRSVWKGAKGKYAEVIKSKKIDFDKGFGPAVDKWVAAHKSL